MCLPVAAGAAGAAALSLDAAGESEQDGEEGFDGVLLLQAQHYQYISGLKWAGGSGRGASLFTTSYDGSLRCMDVQAGVSGGWGAVWCGVVWCGAVWCGVVGCGVLGVVT
jgi:hypothetical protein